MDQVEIIAHRGESHDAPENTLAAFWLAWGQEADAIELDVHVTKDGHLIVCHDPDTRRTTGVPGAIRESTLEALRALDAGSWKGAAWAGERLPTLDEVLETVPEDSRCFIEVKCGPEAAPALVRSIGSSVRRTEQIAVISFREDTLAEAKRRLPEIPAYFLASVRRDSDTGRLLPDVDALIETARQVGASGLDLSFHALDDPMIAERIRSVGLELYVWTIDDLETAQRAAAIGVNGITSNRPSWLRAQLMSA